MKIKKVDYYGLDHAAVTRNFEGRPKFVNEFSITMKLADGGSIYKPVAVYESKNPNRKKGHKDFMLLFTHYNPDTDENDMIVSGRDRAEIEAERYQSAVHCLECDTVLYSIDRHHFHSCGCPNDTFVDGGRDYMRSGAMDLKKTRFVILDLLTDTIKED